MSIKSKLVIRPLSGNNFKEVHKIGTKIFGNSFLMNDLSEYVLSPSTSFVCIKDSDVVAYILTRAVIDDVHIHSIGVDEQYRGIKIGTDLIVFLIDFCKKNNKKKLSLEVSSSNISAIKLYSNVGFLPVGKRKEYYKDGMDAILMDFVI